MKKEVFVIAAVSVFLLSTSSHCFADNGYSGSSGSKRKDIHKTRADSNFFKTKKAAAMNNFRKNLSPVELLGKQIFEDVNLSLNKNQACNSCHNGAFGFADPDNNIAPMARPVSQGSDEHFFGGRNAPTAAYASFSPKLHWNSEEELFIGGLFWDGRASGQPTTATAQGPELGRTEPTGDPLADQAKGPFLNPVEMRLSTLEDVVNIVMNSESGKLFRKLYGKEIYDGTTLNIPKAYNKIAEAIAAFESSFEVNRFSSRFDKFVEEQGGDVSQFGVELTGEFRQYVGPPKDFKSKYLTYDEADGLALFNADSEVQLYGSGANVGGMCYLCHLTERHDSDYGENSTQAPNKRTSDGTYPPIFTDFSYDNLGIPANPKIADLAGPQNIDYGLGAATRTDELSSLNPDVNIGDEEGKFKVSTLRNIAETAPYGHNGFFPTLYSIVHFYNTRDNNWPGESFPAPEYGTTVNTDELGNLGLNFEQEKKLVLFLRTLSDD